MHIFIIRSGKGLWGEVLFLNGMCQPWNTSGGRWGLQGWRCWCWHTIPSRYFLLFLAWEIQRLRRAGRCWRNIRHGSGVTSSPMMDEDAALIFVWGRYRRKLKISSYYTDVCVSFYWSYCIHVSEYFTTVKYQTFNYGVNDSLVNWSTPAALHHSHQ